MGKKNAMGLRHLTGNSVSRKSEDGLFPKLLVPKKIASHLVGGGGKKKKKASFLGLDRSPEIGRMRNERCKTAKWQLASIQKRNIHFRKEQKAHQIHIFWKNASPAKHISRQLSFSLGSKPSTWVLLYARGLSSWKYKTQRRNLIVTTRTRWFSFYL